MSPRKRGMYKIHREVIAQLCKMKKQLYDKKNALKKLKSM